MPRGQAAAIGNTRVAKNGYHYTKVGNEHPAAQNGWVLTHWLTAEKARGGEHIDPEHEMVQFVNGFNKKDYNNPEAVRIIRKNTGSLRKRLAVLEDRIRELEAERDRIIKQLSTKS